MQCPLFDVRSLFSVAIFSVFDMDLLMLVLYQFRSVLIKKYSTFYCRSTDWPVFSFSVPVIIIIIIIIIIIRFV